MGLPLKIDGNLSIEGTKSACEQEQRSGSRLTGIKAAKESALGHEVLENVADFEPARGTKILNELNFVPAKATDNLDAIKTAQSGWTFICDVPEMYVNGKLERRVVFGKKSPIT